MKQEQKHKCTCKPGYHDPNCQCGCNDPDGHCSCGEDCGCTGSNGHCNCHDDNCTCDDTCNCHDDHCDCGCQDQNGQCNCGDNCTCDDTCNCHEDHCDCGCHEEPTKEDYEAVFNQLKQALIEGDKQLKLARDEMMNNQRLAVSYKKDLERYKERNKNIEQDAQNAATEQIAKQLLPILDQFEVALKASAESADKQGYNMIYTSLKKSVENLGISEVESLGLPFDAQLHNAVNKLATKNKKQDGIVTAVYQKGYKLNSTNKILRYAMVEVGEYTK